MTLPLCRAQDGQLEMSSGLKFRPAARKRTRRNPARHSSPATRNPARRTDRSCRDSCYKRSSSRKARTKGSFITDQACKGISCADRTCFAYGRIAETGCMILPVREFAAFPLCRLCEQFKAGERSSARRSLPASALPDEFRWQSDPVPWCGSLCRAVSPCSGRTGSIYDSDSDRWKLRREAEA